MTIVVVEAVTGVGGGLVTQESGEEVAPTGDLVKELGVALLFFTSSLLEELSPPPLFLFFASFFLASLDNIAGS